MKTKPHSHTRFLEDVLIARHWRWEKICPRGNVRRAMAAYYANIETIDEQFSEVVSLEEAGQNMDDWIIIYTTDHGEMLGEHAVWEKQKFFEGKVRIPLA